MGKYMRKAKGVTGEVAVMEVQSPLGVRTRAKTLALQRLAAASAEGGGGDGSYLELRSRRLQKPPASSMVESVRKKKKQLKKKGNLGILQIEKGDEEEGNVENEKKVENEEKGIIGNCGVNKGVEQEQEDEGCFGENNLEFEGRGRTTRESTPCHFITDTDHIKTPGSSTKHSRTSEGGSRVQNSVQMDRPTMQEIDELFAVAEEQQRKQFMEKYNFDPLNDKPLPGRFEWEKLHP